MFLTGINVIEGEQHPMPGWTKINRDLNAGTAGESLYFAYEMDGMYPPITDIVFVVDDEQPKPGYRKIPIDLNKGAGGKRIYAAYTNEPSQGGPLVAVDVKLSDSANPDVPKPWVRVDRDLNQGAGGKYVYLVILPSI
ncbi:hypothetical protein P8605_42345 [Streptomyces sp. T-3]|nr:hypothetical protein [Streptomyces sp. T-3]